MPSTNPARTALRAARPAVSAGVAPLRAVQPRARATRDALLSAGRALLADRDFDALSIAELAGAIGLSVGSFYGRFRDKESFFALLQEQVTAEWLSAARETLTGAGDASRSAGRVIADVVAVTVRAYRRDRGLIRAALKHASNHPGSWTPVRRTGERFVGELVAVLAPRLGHLDPAQREPRTRFAMQMLFGTALNGVLNDPGPLKLDDPGLERELARALQAYLELDG